MKAINLIFTNFIFVMILSCKDEKPPTPFPNPIDTLPKYTETGSNTFACRVNSKIYIAKNWTADTTTYHIRCFYLVNDSSSAYIKCIGNIIKDNYYESISFTINSISDTGTYKLGINFNMDNGKYLIGTNDINNSTYSTNDIDTGEVHIMKYDKVNKIISGKFKFNARYIYGDELIKITNGQFDLKY